MEGREHLFWALMFYSLSIFTCTVALDFRDLNWKWYVVLLVLLFCSIALNEGGNFVKSHNKKLNKNRGKDVPEIKMSREDRLLMNCSWALSYLFLLFTMAFTGIASMPMAGSSLFLVFGYIMAIGGGMMPDFDTMILHRHRNPVTHSGLFPVSIGCLVLLICPVAFLDLCILSAGFLLGYGSHLICDNINSGSTFADAITGLITSKSSPGNIINIMSCRERQWLAAGWIPAMVLVVLTFLRSGEIWFMDYIPIWDGTSFIMSPIPWIVVSFWIGHAIVTVACYARWRG